MFRPFWIIVAITLALMSVAPVSVTAQDEVLVVGQHTITLQKSDRNATTSVREIIQYSVEDEAFSGTLTFDLDTDATITGWFFTNGSGTPLPGRAGQAESDGIPSEDVDGFARHSIDLSEINVTFQPGQTYGLQLFYSLPGEDWEFQRRFTLDTPQLNLFIQSTPGLEPTAEGFDLRAVGSTWTYNLATEDQGPFASGETIQVTFEEVQVPRTPLTVSVTATREDRLRASADGGIPPYAYSWDLDGDGECDDATGQTVELERESVGTHQATACVADARGDAFTARETYETRVVEGPTVTTGPTAWLLALVGLVIGALLVYGLVSGGIIQTGRGRPSGGATTTAGGRNLAVESKDMLAMRQRVMVAALKELEIAKKKGEVGEGLYTPLKAELKQDTVRVMRELEKRKGETV